MEARRETVIKVMETVYGPFVSSSLLTPWKPKPFSENKSRYLWTDAFSVNNFISLFNCTGKTSFLDQADSLINDVHNTLGKDREGKKRLGNSTDKDPLLGGLRFVFFHSSHAPIQMSLYLKDRKERPRVYSGWRWPVFPLPDKMDVCSQQHVHRKKGYRIPSPRRPARSEHISPLYHQSKLFSAQNVLEDEHRFEQTCCQI